MTPLCCLDWLLELPSAGPHPFEVEGYRDCCTSKIASVMFSVEESSKSLTGLITLVELDAGEGT